MTFSASYHKGSGGASFSRVGLHGGRGLALALGGWRGKGRVISGRTSVPGQRCIRKRGAIRDGGGDLSSPSSLPPGGQMRSPTFARIPCFLPHPPPPPPSPQAAVWSDLASSLRLGQLWGQGQGPRFGVLKALVGFSWGPARALPLPFSCPGPATRLCSATPAGHHPFQPLLCSAVHLHLPLA